jgi:hypothetical protein
MGVICAVPASWPGWRVGSMYDGHPAVDFAGVAAEVTTEVALLHATCAELAAHAEQRESCYRRVDPAARRRISSQMSSRTLRIGLTAWAL